MKGRGVIAARLRVLPLVVLVVIVASALALRLRAGRPKIVATIVAAPPSASASSDVAPQASASAGIGAPPPEASARVAERPWRMLHGDAHRTHRARGRLPRVATLAWTFATGGPIEAQVTASPDEQTLYVASHDGTITALTRAGAKKWSVAFGDRIYSAPCVADDGTIYVGVDAKRFVALAPDGRTKWKLDTQGDADTAAAITKEGNVVFAAGTTVVAARPGGDVAWRFQAKKKVFTAAAIADDGKIVFGSQDNRVYALNANGTLAWSVDLGADVDGAPAIADDGSIFVGTDAGEVVKLGANGEIAWRAKVGGSVRGALSIARNGDVLAGVYGPTPRQIRVVASDGALRGAFAIPGTGARDFGVHGGALEDDDFALAFGGQDDAIYVVDGSGVLRWRWVTGGDVDAPLTLLSDGSLVAASDDGKVYFFSP
jgi:outer membrane protein assembly factor BamB